MDGLKLAHTGRSAALRVGAGVPVAMTMKLFVTPMANLAEGALVMVGAVVDGASGRTVTVQLETGVDLYEVENRATG